MLKFKNLTVSNQRYTINAFEGIRHIARAVNIRDAIGADGDYTDPPLYQGVYSKRGESWFWRDKDTEKLIAHGAGNMVIDVYLPVGGHLLLRWRDSSAFSLVKDWVDIYHSHANANYYDISYWWRDRSRWPNEMDKIVLSTTFYVAHQNSKIRVAFSEQTDTEGNVTGRTLSIYENKFCVGTIHLKPQEAVDSSHCSVAIKKEPFTDDLLFMVHIDELCEPVEYMSIDSGETISTALSRLISEQLVLIMSAEGLLLVHKPGPPPTYIFRDGLVFIAHADRGYKGYEIGGTEYYHLVTIEERYDYNAYPSKVRLRSAYPEADAISATVADNFGPNFMLADNPDIVSMAGAKAEASRQLGILLGQAEARNITGPLCPLVHVEDAVYVPGGGVFLVDSIRAGIKGGQFQGVLSLRRWRESIWKWFGGTGPVPEYGP